MRSVNDYEMKRLFIAFFAAGASVQNNYQSFAGYVSRLGCYAVLLKGNDILTRQ